MYTKRRTDSFIAYIRRAYSNIFNRNELSRFPLDSYIFLAFFHYIAQWQARNTSGVSVLHSDSLVFGPISSYLNNKWNFFILFQLRVPKQPSLRLVRRSSATRFVSPLDVQYPSLDHSPDSLPPRLGQFVDLGRLGYQPHVNRDGWNSGHRSVPKARPNRGCLHVASRQLRYAIARGGSEFPRL